MMPNMSAAIPMMIRASSILGMVSNIYFMVQI